jgi:hypothetical protein
MSELDSLFNLDPGLETLDKTVLEKYAPASGPSPLLGAG